MSALSKIARTLWVPILLMALCLTLSNSVFGRLQDQEPTDPIQDPPAAQAELPKASKVLNDYILAKGGAENHQAIETIVSRGTIAIPQSDLRGTIEIYQTAPNKMSMEMSFPGQGKTVTTFNGELGWTEQTTLAEKDPQTNYALLSGERLERFKVQSNLNLYLEILEIFESVECTAIEEFNNEQCYVLVAQDPEVPSITAYFSVDSKMLVGSRISMLQQNEHGEPERMEIVSTLARYRDVGDVKMSHKAVSVFGGLSQIIVMKEIEIGAEIPAGMFEAPEEIAQDK